VNGGVINTTWSGLPGNEGKIVAIDIETGDFEVDEKVIKLF
jgi:hypothetical protein